MNKTARIKLLGMTALTAFSLMVATAFAATIDGTDKGERLKGTSGDDTINAMGGRDKVRGLAGNDTINGGAARDHLRGERGNDTINGDDGNDHMRGGNGDDTQNGGAGNDVIFAGLGVDTSNGGDGDDRLWGLARKDVEGVEGESADTLNGDAGNDVIRARDGEADQISCGDGDNDVAFLDEKDVITDATADNANGSCETVKRSNKRKKADSDSEGTS